MHKSAAVYHKSNSHWLRNVECEGHGFRLHLSERLPQDMPLVVFIDDIVNI